MPWLNTRWVSFFGVTTAVMIIVVSITGWRNYESGVNLKSAINAYGVDVNGDPNNGFTNWTSSNFVLGTLLSFDSFDATKGVLGFRIDYAPLNNLMETDPETVPIVPVRLVLTTTTVNFPANITMPFQTVSQVLDGDINSYPFDIYSFDYTISAYSSPTNVSYGDPLPLTIFSQGAFQGFTVGTKFSGSDDGSSVTITLTVKRSTTTKAFAIIIFMVMWCLSLSIFTAAMSVWFREKKVEPPLIAISTALLFALPNIRNSQPGVPPVAGTTSDMVGFFWNLMLVAISAVSLLVNYIVKNARERPKPVVTDVEFEGRK